MPNNKTFQQAVQGTEYPNTDYWWLNKSMTNLMMITQLIDKDKGVPPTSPESLEARMKDYNFKWAVSDVDADPNAKEPDYKYQGNYDNTFVQTFKTQEDREDLNTKYIAFRNEILDEYDKMCERHANDKDFQATKSLIDFNLIAEDPDRCNFAQAYAANPYIRALFVQSGGMPNFNQSTFKEINEAFSKPSDPEHGVNETPLNMMKSFFTSIESLYDLEGQKQKMVKNGYTPAQEQEYLQNLKSTMENTVKSFDQLRAHVVLHKDDPEIQKGKLMNNELDHITGVAPGEHRHCVRSVGQLKGQMKAIENGWGMDELVYLGCVGEMIADAEMDLARFEYYFRNDQSSIDLHKGSLDDAKADPNTTPEQLANAEKKYKESQEVLAKRHRAQEQTVKLEKELKEFSETVFSKKVNSLADKLDVMLKIDKFIKDNKEKYPDVKTFNCADRDLNILMAKQKAKTLSSTFDSTINELKSGNKGTWFGKKDYDKVITDMAVLDKLYKDAMADSGKLEVTPEMTAKEKEILKGMDNYILRKEIEFRNNAFEGKENNPNSLRRYEIMKKSRDAFRQRSVAGAESEPAKEPVKEPELKPVMPALMSKYGKGIADASFQDRMIDADFIRSNDHCFDDTNELRLNMKDIRENLEATGFGTSNSPEYRRLMRALDDLEANYIPSVPEEARFNKMNALVMLRNAAKDYMDEKHLDAGVDLDKKLTPSTEAGKKHLEGAAQAFGMAERAIANMNKVAAREVNVYSVRQKDGRFVDFNDEAGLIRRDMVFDDATVNQEIVNEEPVKAEAINQEIVNEEPVKDAAINPEAVNEEPVIPVVEDPANEKPVEEPKEEIQEEAEEDIQAPANESQEFSKAVEADRSNIIKGVNFIVNGMPTEKEVGAIMDQMRDSMSRIVAASMLNASKKVPFSAEKIDPLANSIKNNAEMDSIVKNYMNVDEFDELIKDADSINGNALKRQYLLAAEKNKQLQGNLPNENKPVVEKDLNKNDALGS